MPIYVQEKIQPRQSSRTRSAVTRRRREPPIRDLFADFNGLPERRPSGNSTSTPQLVEPDDPRQLALVMNSLAEREGLRGKVQMINIDPPYGIKFDSNWHFAKNQHNVKDERLSMSPESLKYQGLPRYLVRRIKLVSQVPTTTAQIAPGLAD